MSEKTKMTLKTKLRRFLIKLILPKAIKGEWQVRLVCTNQTILCGRGDDMWSAVFNAANRVGAQKCKSQ